MKKLIFGLSLLLSYSAMAGTWCGYSEFIRNNNPSFKEATEVIRVRALMCQDLAGSVTSVGPKGQSCTLPNATIGNNLVSIADNLCQKDWNICMGAYNALRTWDPVNLKNNPAYDAIFTCKTN